MKKKKLQFIANVPLECPIYSDHVKIGIARFEKCKELECIHFGDHHDLCCAIMMVTGRIIPEKETA